MLRGYEMPPENVEMKSNEPLPNHKKIYVGGKSRKDLRVPFREITLQPTHLSDGEVELNESLLVYDTSGPWGDDSQSCDIRSGLVPLRRDWILDRDDVEEYEGR